MTINLTEIYDLTEKQVALRNAAKNGFVRPTLAEVFMSDKDFVEVIGRTIPEAPTIGTVTLAGTTASVPFTAPANNGGSTILSYTATSTPGNITGTLSQAGSGTITVSGLPIVSGNFVVLNQGARSWLGMASAPNGDVYACTYASCDIYKQTGGTGNFVALGQSAREWRNLTVAPNGDIYATSRLEDIYKQTGGTGNFVALNQGARSWLGMASAPNGDVYASTNEDIYKQTGGTGNFVALGQVERLWIGMTAAPNGDIYACVYNGDIYKQTGGIGNFVALSQETRSWYNMTSSPNGDVYACVYNNGDIYKQTGGIGNFVALNQGARSWLGITYAPNGDLYGCSASDIYKSSRTTTSYTFKVKATNAVGTGLESAASNTIVV